MAQVFIPVAAAGLGYWIFGATGAAAAYTAASILTADRTQIDMPSIGDLRVQRSQAGAAIPFVAGTQRMAGNIIWSTDKVPNQVKQRSGGKGGFAGGGTETTVTTYSISMAIAICRGPILGIKRCWKDGTLVAEAGSGQSKLPGTLYLGNNTQNPDSTIVSAEGDAPAYHGIAYLVLEDFDLGGSGRVPHFSCEVVREGGL